MRNKTIKISKYLFLIILLTSCASNQNSDLSQNEKKAEIFYTYGTQALVQKNYTDALDNLLKAYEINPKDSKLNNNLGMAYFFKGRSDKAIEYLKKAIELDSKNSDAKNNLASIYFNLEQYALAKELYVEVLNDLVYQNHFRVLHSLALISIHERNFPEAEKYLHESISENIDYCAAHYTYGKLELSRGHIDEAINHLKNANKGTCFSEQAPIIALAQTYYETGKLDLAKAKFLEYIERFPTGSYAKEAQNFVERIGAKNDSSFNSADSVIKSQSAPKRKSAIDNDLQDSEEYISDPKF